jgi:hypothetical protein
MWDVIAVAMQSSVIGRGQGALGWAGCRVAAAGDVKIRLDDPLYWCSVFSVSCFS